MQLWHTRMAVTGETAALSSAVPLTIAGDELHVWFVNLADASLAWSSAEARLSADELLRARAFRFERDRDRYAASHAALREILGRYVGEPAALRLGTSASGKPFIEQPSDAPRFNLSHSGDVCAIAISLAAEVGIDVETLQQPLEDVHTLATTCFSPPERAALASSPPDEERLRFLRGWTRKEAYLKATGEGLRTPLDAFSVRLDANDPHAIAGAEAWLVLPLRAAEGIVAAAVVPRGNWRVTERWW